MAKQLLEELVDAPSVLRKIIFATINLQSDLPDYWKIVTNFATCGTDQTKLTPSKIQTLVDNMHYYDKDTFLSEQNLMSLLLNEQGRDGKPLGIVLISPRSKCQACNGDLIVKADRPSHLTLYSDNLGTVTAVHFKDMQKFMERCLWYSPVLRLLF